MVDKLTTLFAKLSGGGSSTEDEEKQTPVLTSFDLQGIADYIHASKPKNVITMSGAGISTSAGIPDFRSPNSGLYAKLASYELPYPEAIFSIDYFKKQPEPFYKLTKELWPKKMKPTPAHYFITMLHEKGYLLRSYTQNIDGLDFVAALPPEKIVEAHGSFKTGQCLKCKATYDIDWLYERAVEQDQVPVCSSDDCDGVVKPDVVFFGEQLPSRFFSCVMSDFAKCDLLIIIGTSLKVQPFASLIDRVPKNCPRLLINLEKVGVSDGNPLAALFGGGGSMQFDSKDNYRDVFHGATCDDGCRKLAEHLGWLTELEERIKQQHELIEKHPVKPYSAPQQQPSDSAEASNSQNTAGKD